MQSEATTTAKWLQDDAALSTRLGARLSEFVDDLATELDRLLDKRLVRTFLGLLVTIIRLRNRPHGLLLSELGGVLLSAAQAAAGTKRISNLLRSQKWQHRIIERFLWKRADGYRRQLQDAGQTVLACWDDSVIEKPESLKAEGLCAVRSSKAQRLKRVRPGFYAPPTFKPIFVPGLEWMALLLVGYSQRPVLAAMRWWTRRAALPRLRSSDRRSEQLKLLKAAARTFGRRVVHLFDRGYAGAPWLEQLIGRKLRFVMRWPKRMKLMLPGAAEPVNAWRLLQGKRSISRRTFTEATTADRRSYGIAWIEVRHADHPQTRLWLVVSRPGKGRSPWYLLTSEPVRSADDAWQIVLAYRRRWQIEMAFRYSKSELAMESPRLWFWDNRMKLLMIVALVYAFLLSLLDDALEQIRTTVLDRWCHRTGKRSRRVSAPLYRLRSALSALWSSHPPHIELPTPG
jgi:hypothetical protein